MELDCDGDISIQKEKRKPKTATDRQDCLEDGKKRNWNLMYLIG